MGDLSHLQRTKVDFVVGEAQVRSNYFTAIVNINFIGCNLSSNNFAADIIFFSVALTIFEPLRTIDYERFEGLQWE